MCERSITTGEKKKKKERKTASIFKNVPDNCRNIRQSASLMLEQVLLKQSSRHMGENMILQLAQIVQG